MRTSTFADKTMVKLDYSSFISPTGTAFPSFQICRLNGIFDPDFTGTGHQPYGYDQWKTFYNKSTVFASSIKVRVSCNSAGSNYQFVVFPTITQPLPTAFNTSVSATREIPYCKWSQGTQSTQAKQIRHYATTHGIFGVPKRKITDEADYTETNTNVALPAFWYIMAQNCDEITNTSFTIQYEVTYYVQFWDRITITQS